MDENEVDKDTLRARIWNALEASGEARFPFPPHDRIPNFAGADRAADRLTRTTAWGRADAVKVNPDAPQLPVRRAALRAGKELFVAVPRLRDPDPFVRLDPEEVTDVDEATTVSGISEYGEAVPPEALPRIDLVVAGSVAVTTGGARVGKGEGYSDLEYAVLRELGAVDPSTTVATTVHELQVVGEAPVSPHDVPLDLVVTPERVVRTGSVRDPPAGIDWSLLSTDRRAAIPVLERFAPGE